MQLTESKTIEIALPRLKHWLIKEHDLVGANYWREKVTVDGTRADGVVVGMCEEGQTTTLSVEAKSSKTLRQLFTHYDDVAHAGESILLGGLGLIVHPFAALAALGANIVFGKARHLDCDAALQALGYPGDFRILVIPADVLKDYEDMKDDLCKLCKHLGLGLVTVDQSGNLDWLCEPEPVKEDDGEWLDQYKTGNRMREELAKDLGIDLNEEDEDDEEDEEISLLVRVR